jgi:hypothetical protein
MIKGLVKQGLPFLLLHNTRHIFGGLSGSKNYGCNAAGASLGLKNNIGRANQHHDSLYIWILVIWSPHYLILGRLWLQ